MNNQSFDELRVNRLVADQVVVPNPNTSDPCIEAGYDPSLGGPCLNLLNKHGDPVLQFLVSDRADKQAEIWWREAKGGDLVAKLYVDHRGRLIMGAHPVGSSGPCLYDWFEIFKVLENLHPEIYEKVQGLNDQQADLCASVLGLLGAIEQRSQKSVDDD